MSAVSGPVVVNGKTYEPWRYVELTRLDKPQPVMHRLDSPCLDRTERRRIASLPLRFAVLFARPCSRCFPKENR